MATIKYDLVVRFDEARGRFVFFTLKRSEESSGSGRDASFFAVEIGLDELKSRGSEGAEKLIGESVLGFFDHLTNGRLDLPKRYLDDS